ncbi:MAG: hypothetical protein RLN76_06445 [Phycisphaeraceae bacterium]
MINTTADIMEQASRALAERDYLTAEQHAEQALLDARQRESWDDYARILMPLQESRRQRRIIAAEGWLLLGSESSEAILKGLAEAGPEPGPKPHADPGSEPGKILAAQIVLTAPIKPDDAERIWREARRRRLWVELLMAEGSGNARKARSWRNRSIEADILSPPDLPHGTWIEPAKASKAPKQGLSGSAWFQLASEQLGDAALKPLTNEQPSIALLDRLAQAVDAVPDHEILHQRLWDSARDLQRITSPADTASNSDH